MAADLTAIEPRLGELGLRVGDARNIDEIAIIGGGSQVFASLLKAAFPQHGIRTLHQPIFFNMRGYNVLGQHMIEPLTCAS